MSLAGWFHKRREFQFLLLYMWFKPLLIIFVFSAAFTPSASGTDSSSRLLSFKQDKKCGYMDKTGHVVISAQFDSCYSFSEGIAAVVVDRELRFIDDTGRFISEQHFNYDFARFSEGYAAVSIGDSRVGIEKRGFIDQRGFVVFLPSVTSIYDFSEGLAVFEKDRLRGFIDTNMNVVVEPKYIYASSFSDGLARVQDDHGVYFIDKAGHMVIDSNGSDFSEGLSRVEVSQGPNLNDKIGFMDVNGRIVIQPQFDEAGWFHEGLVGVRLKDKWGYIDRTGQLVIAPQFDEVGDFAEGLAAVKLNETWGFIDRLGKIVIPFAFENADSFDDGIAGVKVDDEWRYIDKEGKYIEPQE